MSYFEEMHFDNTTYDLSHLDPFKLGIRFDGNAYTALVMFSCHCFTEKFDAARHDVRAAYEHENETRAFDEVRYRLSLSLPSLFRNLGNQTVYHTHKESFFFIRNERLPDRADGIPYAVFFRTHRAEDRDDADVIVRVVSAYAKPGITRFARPVKFPRVIDSAARRIRLKLGPPCKVKRR
ncbi:MAG: hypothetical protein OXI87_24270 [Albidovulum sp.]|nr:hypothetical protein [Albidovulum sp.]MDE0530755.1 hypothetical protein [Albidovulum sp.]